MPRRATRKPLSPDLLRRMDAYWRAANYLSVGQIYLYDNPLLKRPLRASHIKPRLLGHWGTTPGLNFIYVHLNRLIKAHDLTMLYIAGPGHGGPALVANTWLEGVYSEVYPDVTPDEAGMRRLFKQFSFPGGVPSHVAPETPGSIHEGGELGYALAHACGAAFDNPDLVIACVIGDGEAETGPLATSWHGNKFLNPARDGAVLPILHLNGYKIAGPTVLARIPRAELDALLSGCGYRPIRVAGDDPPVMHQAMAAALDEAIADIRACQNAARARPARAAIRPRWPVIVLETPKGWTGPKTVDGKRVEGTFRAHQVPMGEMSKPSHVKLLERWMKSYRPRELFDGRDGSSPTSPSSRRRAIAAWARHPHANGGLLLRDLRLPDYRRYAVKVPKPGVATAEATRVQGEYVRDVMKLNADARNFRVFSPDETASNRWGAVFEATDRCLVAETRAGDDHVAPDGRVMEVLSRAPLPGLARGLPPHRAPRLLLLLRGLRPHRRLDVQPARQVAEGRAPDPVAALDRLAQHPAHLARLAPGPQRLLAPGPGLHRPRGQQEGRDDPRVPAAGREHAAVRDRAVPAQPRQRERDRRRQAAAAAVARHGRRDPALHRRHRHLGVGVERPRRRARRGDGVRRRCADDGDAGRGVAAAPPLAGRSRCGWSTSST